MRTFNKTYNSIFFSIFILLFFSLYLLRVNLFSYAIPLLITEIILIFYLLFKYIKNINYSYFKNIFLKKTIIIFIIFFLLFLLETFHFDYNFNYNLFTNKQTCQNILLFLSENENLKFIIFNLVCVYSKSAYYVISFFLVLILVYYIDKINLEKIFLSTGILFCIISIAHFVADVYIRIYHHGDILYETLKIYNHSNNYAYFQLLPFYSAGYRNVEIYPIILGFVSSIYLMISNPTKKKYIFISCFIGTCLFLTFSRVAWVISFILIIYFLIIEKKIIIKYFINQVLVFIIFTLIFTYFWNYSDLIFLNDKSDPNHIARSNFFFYTMMKITSLINTELSNYFNYLNKDAWYYYNISPLETDQSGYLNIEKLGGRDFYNNYVELYMQQHLNSVPSRLEIYSNAIGLIKEKFIFGYSANKFSFGLLNSDINATINNPMITSGNAESNFLQIFIEHGFVGFSTKLLLFYFLIKYSYENKDTFNIAILIMLIVFSLFVTLSFYFFYWITLSIVFSRIISFKNKKIFT